MITDALITTGMTILGLTPEDRLNALKSISNNKAGSNGTVWTVVIVVFVIAVLALLAIKKLIEYLKQKAEADANWALFYTRSREKNLGQEEVDMLSEMVMLLGLEKQPHSVLTLENDFTIGAERLLEVIAEESDEEKIKYEKKVDRLRAKLGFGPSESGHGQSSSRQIREGTKVTISSQSMENELAATVVDCNIEYISISLGEPVSSDDEEGWLMRFIEDGVLWEFETKIISKKGDLIYFEHADKMSPTNLRRFQRVPVEHRALVGHFMFQTHDEHCVAPEWVEGTVVELAGPGLKLSLPETFNKGDRIIAILEIESKRILQSLGIIRNVYSSKNSGREYGVELLGLSPTEVSELARLTKQASTQTSRFNNPAEWKEDALATAQSSDATL